MTSIFANQALLPSGWAQNVLVKINTAGRIETITVDNPDNTSADHSAGVLLPSPVNAHSHAFQRAMAGLTERRGPNPNDSFWTWRQLMFRFLDQLTPDDVEAIAAFVQMEMLESGYATNVEFHYLHHQPGGIPYDSLSEMAERIAAAAHTSGIGLTLLPVHYEFGGCDRRELGPGQIRFGNNFDRFAKLYDGAADAAGKLTDDAATGLAPHSLRAVAPEDLPRLAELANGRPIHLHLAEQIPEVDEVKAAWGSRPVEWILDNTALSSQWCMIHCTQMLPHETEGLAKSGAVAGLCPVTESSLGDGIFDGLNWLQHGGALAIGSDSNIRISLSEELRTLDYSQRLRDHSRAALATQDKSTARNLFDQILAGGAVAANRDCGGIEKGLWADLITLDTNHIDLDGRTGDVLLDSYVFAGDDRMVKDVWSAGRHLVADGIHKRHSEIEKKYRTVLRRLGDHI